VFAAPTVVVEQEMMVEDMAMEEAPSTETGNGVVQASESPRLRQFFPETMLWLPEAVTDENGNLNLEFSLADSITTWRMTAMASSKDGRLGSVTVPMRVFQDFFIDLDLPVSLTAGDEVSVPVAVYNYLAEEQSVRLEIEESGWFELMGSAEQEITIPANDVSVVYFRVKAIAFGKQTIKVTAWGSKMSDAIQKEVQVYPNGKQIRFSQSDRLTPGEGVQYDASIPEDAVSGQHPANALRLL